MKRTTIALIFSLMSLNAFAARINPADLESYKEAVGLALEQHPLNCEGYSAGRNYRRINLATSGAISSNGSQNLIFFSSDFGIRKDVFQVTTSPDYKSVVAVNFERTVCRTMTHDVNLGDLNHPKIVSQTSPVCQIIETASCK